MFPAETYISLGISPDAAALVLQPVIPGTYRPCFPMRFSIHELDSFGRPEAIERTGRIALSGMRAFYPLINIYAEALILMTTTGPFTIDVPDSSGAIRAKHLRIHFSDADRSIVIRRFDGSNAAGHDPSPMVLEHLIDLGPAGVTNLVGTTVLSELVALHPEAFARFSALRAN